MTGGVLWSKRTSAMLIMRVIGPCPLSPISDKSSPWFRTDYNYLVGRLIRFFSKSAYLAVLINITKGIRN